RFSLLLGRSRDQHDAVAHADLDGTIGLAGNFTRFQRDLVGAVLKCLGIVWTYCTHFLFPASLANTMKRPARHLRGALRLTANRLWLTASVDRASATGADTGDCDCVSMTASA